MNQKIVNYFNQNKGQYTQEQLIQALISAGYTESDVKEAAAIAYGSMVNNSTPTIPVDPAQPDQGLSNVDSNQTPNQILTRTIEDKIKVRYWLKTTAVSSIALATFSFILLPFIELYFMKEFDAQLFVFAVFVDYGINIPFLIYGLKIKKATEETLVTARKQLNFMRFYGLVMPIVILLMGGRVGILLWVVDAYYFMTYQVVDKYLKGQELPNYKVPKRYMEKEMQKV